MQVTFPNESKTYRSSREKLLNAEIDLRQQVEKVGKDWYRKLQY
jgi:predicted dithiol-disulfide oxidoreductase (DUF899 family)